MKIAPANRPTAALWVLTGLISFATLGNLGCASARAFRTAENEEIREHWDLAVLAYEKALALEPENPKFKIALARAKMRAAQAHYERARMHRSAGQLELAALEYEQSVALDPTNDTALQDWKRTVAAIETRNKEAAEGTPVEKAKQKARGSKGAPPILNPASDGPIDLIFPSETNIKKIYQFLGSAAGINIIFDHQLKDDKFTLTLRGTSFQKALETALGQAGHFYKVIDERTILIAQDTPQNRKEYEDLVIRTFFLSNGDVKDVSGMVRSILDLRRLATIPQLNAIVIRDTADKVAVAERIIEVNDKAKAEVIVDVELLQLNAKKTLDIGTKLSAYSTTGGLTRNPATGATPSTAIASVPWKDLFKIGLNDFNFTVPAITFSFIKSNSDAELLAKPQLRIAEGEKAQLTIGDRIPIPVTTINTQQAVGGTGVIPITSFQYQDVGIKIEMEPRVHHNKEITLKLTVEVSQQSGFVETNGQRQPIIGTRTITSTIRLKDGETNILAGLIRKDLAKTKSTIPFLGDLPLIGPLFSSNSDEYNRTDVFLTLTPHIIRAPQITEEDLIPIWVGTENNVSFSGLNTRLESPRAPGSPFDPEGPQPGPGQPTAPQAVPGVGPAPRPTGIIQGTPPTDPFRRDTKSSPPQTPPSNLPNLPGANIPRGERQRDSIDNAPEMAPAPGPSDAASVSLALRSALPELGVGQTVVVALEGLSGLSELASLELAVEWDPAVTEVLGVAPGPWRDSDQAQAVRFEADRVPGRARLHFKRPFGKGLPSGSLVELAVRGVTPGVSLFRASAASASRVPPLSTASIAAAGTAPKPVIEPLTVVVHP